MASSFLKTKARRLPKNGGAALANRLFASEHQKVKQKRAFAAG
jgi:hypothetical protein